MVLLMKTTNNNNCILKILGLALLDLHTMIWTVLLFHEDTETPFYA